jgi:hypothetical protein
MSSTETRVTENDGIIVGWNLEERINGIGVELEKLRGTNGWLFNNSENGKINRIRCVTCSISSTT